MEYKVTITKRAKKTAAKMPPAERLRPDILVKDLVEHGPILPGWKNYGALSAIEYHCHLSYHWVAVGDTNKEP